MNLACGGHGPCCHIGYPHRHCEHCDVVIPTYHYHYGYPWGPYWGSGYSWGSAYQINGYSSALTNQLQQALAQNAHTHAEVIDINGGQLSQAS